MKKILLFLLLFTSLYVDAQKKQAFTTFTAIPPKIDGILTDSVWKKARSFSDFVVFRPNNGEQPSHKTDVRILNDDNALYFGIVLHDERNRIMKNLSPRDNVDADNFIIHLAPFNDGQSWYEFWLTASGVQNDAFVEPKRGWNTSWNAVWESNVQITDSGWTAEIRIPYKCMPFPVKDEQVWGFNLFRQRRTDNEDFSWSRINVYGPSGSQFFSSQQGELRGIGKIKPQDKLFLWPYLSFSTFNNSGSTFKSRLKGGLDLKYAIGSNFMLDMITIPDFSTVRQDDKFLNLSPFETYFSEQRQFFIQGTELFNKADVFYSRRTGGMPSGFFKAYNQLNSNEVIVQNDLETPLINATKLTGRTSGGLGIGILNAITGAAYALAKDTLTENTRKINTQSLTNYNVVAIEQTLKNNSTISLINTNLTRLKSPDENTGSNLYQANVSALDMKFFLGDYSIAAVGAASYRNIENNTGFRYSAEFAKEKGKFRFNVSTNRIDNHYNPNDLGFLAVNNSIYNHLGLGYVNNIASGTLREWNSNIWIDDHRLYSPNERTFYNIGFSTRPLFANNFFLEYFLDLVPGKVKDIYEPRSSGMYFIKPSNFRTYLNASTDGNKRISIRAFAELFKEFGQGYENRLTGSIEPMIRFSDHFQFRQFLRYSLAKSNRGFDGYGNNQVYFANRDITNFESVSTIRYIFSPNSNLELRLRNSYTYLAKNSFYQLDNFGLLNPTTNYQSSDANFNLQTTFLDYNWRFSPGSVFQLTVKQDYISNQLFSRNYFENYTQIYKTLPSLSVIVKILYYISPGDYLKIKRS